MSGRPTLNDFNLNRNLIAARIPPEERGGLFKKAMAVPLHAAALAIHPDGAVQYFGEGQDVGGKHDLLLAKGGEIELKMIFPDLKTRDGFGMNATCAFVVRVLVERPDLFRDFLRACVQAQATFTTSDLKSFLARELKRILGEFVGRYDAATLNRKGAIDDFSEMFDVNLERFVFGSGLKYERLLDVSFASHDFEENLEGEKRRQAEEAEAQVRLKRKEERLKHILEDSSIQMLLAQVKDEKMRAVLYAKLMEDEAYTLTAEDLARQMGNGPEVLDLVRHTMQNLMGAPAADADDVPAEKALKIFVASGPKVLEFDPQAPSATPKSHVFPMSLRSVRSASTMYGPSILGGGKSMVALMTGAEGAPAFLQFPMPPGVEPRGGVNSIAVDGRTLVATHSEYGLACWDLNRPGEPARILHNELTSRHKTTRAATAAFGRLFFASGANVYAIPLPMSDDAPPAMFETRQESPVTAVTATPARLYAGTASGAIVAWAMDKPAEPAVVVRRKDPISSVRLARLSRIPHLLYTAHDLAVRARVVGQSLETEYESGGTPVAFMDAASDVIAALDSAAGRLLVWRATAPGKPEAVIDCQPFSAKPVLDVWIAKGPG